MGTPPLESVMTEIRESKETYGRQLLQSNDNSVTLLTLNQTTGSQLDIITSVGLQDMKNGDMCGIRVLSSITNVSDITPSMEFTDVYIQFWNCSFSIAENMSVCKSVTLNVDTTFSNSNFSIAVNRSICTSGHLNIIDSNLESTLELRTIVDHSVVESFLGSIAERAVTRRSYPSNPTQAINVHLFSRCGDGNSACLCDFRNSNSWKLRSTSQSQSDDDSNKSNFIWVYIFIGVVGFVAIIVFAIFLVRRLHGKTTQDAYKLMDAK